MLCFLLVLLQFVVGVPALCHPLLLPLINLWSLVLLCALERGCFLTVGDMKGWSEAVGEP